MALEGVGAEVTWRKEDLSTHVARGGLQAIEGVGMDLLMTAAAGVVLGIILVAVGVTSYRLWRAGMYEERPLLMHRVLEHEGANVERCTDEGALAQIATAARGCLLCRDKETCLAWLEGDAPVSLQQFCPNAEMIGRLKADARPPARSRE
jgi:hypothetical protein